MADVQSAPFRFRALPTATARWGTIPNAEGYEGTTITVDVSNYYTDGAPPTTDFSVSLYSDSAGTNLLASSHVLAGIAVIDDSNQIITFDLTGVDITQNTDVWVRVTGHQP